MMNILKNPKIKSVLLIDPDFPASRKSRNHRDLLPVGLLKIGAYYKSQGIKTKLIRLNKKKDFTKEILDFSPDLVLVTSVFTYWSKEVKEAVEYSKNILPDVNVVVGGVFASLLPEKCKEYTGCDYVYEGIFKEAEGIAPDYTLLGDDANDIDYQIIHATRGCIRKCGFCGVYKIEPDFKCKESIRNEIIRKKLVFYDNNLLASSNIEKLLEELIQLKKEKIISSCESQSGFDGRVLLKNPKLAILLKKANFISPKIAWDGSVKTAKQRKKEIDVLIDAGYNSKDISIFMIYNYDLDYLELEEKRAFCFKWGVQVSDCRYRPLNRLDDNYNPNKRKGQSNKHYHINPNWTDEEVRAFRRNVRRHNICIRHNMQFYSNKAERMKISKEESMEYRDMSFDEVKKYLDDAWNPAEITYIADSKQTRLI